MAIKKDSAGVEDIIFGMGTRVQLRKGSEVVITELNGNYIPYSETQSTNQKIDEVDSKIEAPTNGLNNHVADKGNPHEVTAEQANAEPELGNPAQDGYILSSSLVGTRSWIPAPSGGSGSVAWGDITGLLSNQTDLQNALNLKLNVADPVFTGTLTGYTAQAERVELKSSPEGISRFSWQLWGDIDENATLVDLNVVSNAFTALSGCKELKLTTDVLQWGQGYVVLSDVTQNTGAKVIENMVEITQTDYDALTPVDGTVYFIVG